MIVQERAVTRWLVVRQYPVELDTVQDDLRVSPHHMRTRTFYLRILAIAKTMMFTILCSSLTFLTVNGRLNQLWLFCFQSLILFKILHNLTRVDLLVLAIVGSLFVKQGSKNKNTIPTFWIRHDQIVKVTKRFSYYKQYIIG